MFSDDESRATVDLTEECANQLANASSTSFNRSGGGDKRSYQKAGMVSKQRVLYHPSIND